MAAVSFFGLALSLGLSSGPRVATGLDVLRGEGGSFLEGRRVGLLSHSAARAVDGTPALEVLRERGLSVVALFSPEHGYDADRPAGDEISGSRDPESKVPIHSLYGETRSPTPEMLSGIDTLVFDLQDVGVRFFTYVTTMKLAMRSAAAADIEFVVLDRPNPQGGLRVEGPMLEPRLESFVGALPVPLVHGMTVGELALFLRGTEAELSGLKLRVVEMRGWERRMLWDDTGLPWRPPSPNLRTSRSALAYPAFGLMEGVEISEGRGTEETFERVGAPWVDETALAEALIVRKLPGVRFRPLTFVPEANRAAPSPRFRGELCRGVALSIDDERNFEPVRAGLTAIETLRSLFPGSFRWVRHGEAYWIDLLLGSDRPRRGFEAGASAEDVLALERPAVEKFLFDRTPYLLY